MSQTPKRPRVDGASSEISTDDATSATAPDATIERLMSANLELQQQLLHSLADNRKANERADAAAEDLRKANERADAIAEERRKANERADCAAEDLRKAIERADAAAEERRKANERADAIAEERRKANERADCAAEDLRKANERADAAAEERRKANDRADAAAEERRKANERADAVAEDLRKANSLVDAVAEERRKANDRADAAAEDARLSNERADANAEDARLANERADTALGILNNAINAMIQMADMSTSTAKNARAVLADKTRLIKYLEIAPSKFVCVSLERDDFMIKAHFIEGDSLTETEEAVNRRPSVKRSRVISAQSSEDVREMVSLHGNSELKRRKIESVT